ncbi:hypothetical protein H9L39_18759 [Fusarium oxysporum f. sp. albedinis]|nr:hypothetical protein H9L39_18759 [Fusarium oxysporum f. sp. albedinis]
MSPWVGGCDDQVMHLISEIACLESPRKDGMDNFTFYLHVFILRTLVISTKGDAGPKMPVNADGSLSHKQLSKNITMAFRIAACIFLRSLAPRFNARQKFLMKLFPSVLRYIPSDPDGFDRNVSWVYLVGGSISVPDSTFRAFFEDCLAQIGDSSRSGTMGRLTTVLHEVWLQNDNLSDVSAPESTASEK